MLQPILTTPRPNLIPLSDEHLPDEVALDADAAVMRFVGSGSPRTAAEVAVAHRDRIGRASDGLGFWAGFVGTSFVGWWLLTAAADDARGDAELGYRLHQQFWRQGLATEGATALLNYGFKELKLRQIFASTLAVSTGSRAVMERLGLHHIDTRTSADLGVIAASEEGDVDYAVTASHWLALPTPAKNRPHP